MKGKTEIVSVVISVFNGERHLEASVGSVLSQEGVNLEVVAINDGSSDNSGAILDRLAGRDPRLRVFHRDNVGLTRALAWGCAEARGEFIARHDVDDLSKPGRLARQAGMLKRDPSLVFVSSWVGLMGPEGEFLAESRYPEDSAAATRDLVERGAGFAHGSVMFRRSAYEAVGGYRSDFYFTQDWDLWLRLVDEGQLGFVPDALYLCRVSETSLSAKYGLLQARLRGLAAECRKARRAGHSEEPFLFEARQLRPGLVPPERIDPAGAASLYFLSRALLARQDRRGLIYAARFLRARPLSAKGWASAAWGMISAWKAGATYTG